jgi:formyl-CoA transferase
VRRHPPLLGEHTSEVLRELGIGPEEQAQLQAQGAFAP